RVELARCLQRREHPQPTRLHRGRLLASRYRASSTANSQRSAQHGGTGHLAASRHPRRAIHGQPGDSISAPLLMVRCARPIAGGVEMAVKVTPRSGRAGVAGVINDAAGVAWLDVRVAEPPEGGRATRAAIRLVAERCGVAAGSVELVVGASSRW